MALWEDISQPHKMLHVRLILFIVADIYITEFNAFNETHLGKTETFDVACMYVFISVRLSVNCVLIGC